MQLDYNQICNENSEVDLGKVYLYTEGNLEFKVNVLEFQFQPRWDFFEIASTGCSSEQSNEAGRDTTSICFPVSMGT